MTKFSVVLTNDLSVNSHSLTAYSASISTTDEPLAEFLADRPVRNNAYTQRGIFAALQDACRVIGESIGLPLVIVEMTDHLGGYTTYSIERHGKLPTPETGCTHRVIYSR